ncbi:hypothetical protein [Streptomyces sp. NPDC090445]|uniref:hypothetical protein n=1 Tax=Streptomyces sp. NPDC090445 TaxID=3365963 RepID=UPI003803910D
MTGNDLPQGAPPPGPPPHAAQQARPPQVAPPPAPAPPGRPPQAPPGFGPPVPPPGFGLPVPPPGHPPAATARAEKRIRIWTAVALALCGAFSGYLAHLLAANARAYCDAGWEAGGKFELFLNMLLLVPGCALLAVLVWLPLRRAHPTAGVAAVLLVLVVVVLWYFAANGTPVGVRGESGLCGPDNVPPWWPPGLPS